MKFELFLLLTDPALPRASQAMAFSAPFVEGIAYTITPRNYMLLITYVPFCSSQPEVPIQRLRSARIVEPFQDSLGSNE